MNDMGLPAAVQVTAAGKGTPLAFAPSRRITPPAQGRREPWKVLVADDDPDIQAVSRLLLRDVTFEGRPLHLLSAGSAAETCRTMEETPDVAVLLLDVVMEREDAGFEVIRHIREVLKNDFVRIVLRTGQPGQAPERAVVERYDINDYKEKTELTAQKLITTIYSALRAYRDMRRLDTSRRGLEYIIGASARLFRHQALRQFNAAVLSQLTALLTLIDPAGIGSGRWGVDTPAALSAVNLGEGFEILAGTDIYVDTVGLTFASFRDRALIDQLRGCIRERRSLITDRTFIGYFQASTGAEMVVYLFGGAPFGEIEARLLRVFSANIEVGFENVCLSREVLETQTEIVQTLSDVVETRSVETSRHTRRVGECAGLMAELLGMTPADVDLLRQVAPMHDLGKVGIPDAVLNKPGPLTPEEYDWVKAHTTIGYNLLKGSSRPLLKTAAVVCLQHHERWDGGGYPQGLVGEEVTLLSRIVGVVDVFDAVSHDRPYKSAWPPDRVYEYIAKQRGVQFDPVLADVLLGHFSAFQALCDPSLGAGPPELVGSGTP